MAVPKYLRYTRDHEWARFDEEESLVYIGITDYAQAQIGDITYVELPEEEDEVEKGKAFGEIEHHKGVEPINSPVSGKVVEINDSISDTPELINQDPYDEGWLIKVECEDVSELDELMDGDEYETYLAELDDAE